MQSQRTERPKLRCDPVRGQFSLLFWQHFWSEFLTIMEWPDVIRELARIVTQFYVWSGLGDWFPANV